MATFRTELLLAKKTATGVQVPEEVVTGLGAGKKFPVKVTINGYTYRSTIASMNGVFMIPVSADVRSKAGVAAGDLVDVALKVDTEPREVAVPEDLAQALASDSAARKNFMALSYSNKLRHVLSVEEAKTQETRRRRIEKALIILREG